jgi:DNA phosphorothioation-associated putative methyltransferase
MPTIRPERTAIARKGPSTPTLAYEGLFKKHGVKTILDYGCGKGADVRWLTSKGYKVHGYDPHFAPTLPNKVFDAVMLNYVLCVIPDADQRDALIDSTLDLVKAPGLFCVAVRPKATVDREAKQAKWKKHADGWLTKNGTFQKGYTKEELLDFCGLSLHDHVGSWVNSWSVAVMVKLW